VAVTEWRIGWIRTRGRVRQGLRGVMAGSRSEAASRQASGEKSDYKTMAMMTAVVSMHRAILPWAVCCVEWTAGAIDGGVDAGCAGRCCPSGMVGLVGQVSLRSCRVESLTTDTGTIDDLQQCDDGNWGLGSRAE
jgi:hypothetical protein